MTEYFLDTTYNTRKNYETGKDMKWLEWAKDERSKPLKVTALNALKEKDIKGVRIDKRSGKDGYEEMTTTWVKFK